MEAQHRASRSGDGSGWNGYRCRPGTHRSISTDIAGHPKNVDVREDTLLERLDEWIASFTKVDWLAAGQEAAGGENPAAMALHERIKELDRKIDNLVVAFGAEACDSRRARRDLRGAGTEIDLRTRTAPGQSRS